MAKLSFAEKIRSLFSKNIDNSFFEEIEDALIEGDIGAKTAVEISALLKTACKKSGATSESEIKMQLYEILLPYLQEVSLSIEKNKTNIWMLLGVNGVGKTTSAAKLANMYSEDSNQNIVLAASDTFRAAAIEQLTMHANKLKVRIVSHQHGSDPSAVIYDALDAIRAKGGGLVIADTAGRLHNKEGLVRELEKIHRTCKTRSDENCYKRLLVLDATTGQNALRQAEVFNEAIGVDAIILTKFDSSAKGGIAFTIGKELNLPVAFVCTGESYSDISTFNKEQYVRTFLGM